MSKSRSQNWAIAAVLAAMVLVVLDASMATMALPSIARSLDVVPASSIRVITAYQTALLMALLPCAALGESLGYRRVFIAGVATFTLASGLCALSPSLPWLVAARVIQGVGGATVMALGIAMLQLVVSPRHLGRALGWNALAVALSSAAGPAIGAAIIAAVDWHWLFAIKLPLGIGVVLAGRALPHIGGTAQRLDLVSVALNFGVIASLIFSMELLLMRPPLAVMLGVVSVVLFAALIRRALTQEAPLLPLDLLRVDSFRFSVFASVNCFAGQSASMIALPFYLQQGLSQDTLTSGLYMTAWPLAVAATAPFAGHLADRLSTAWQCTLGGFSLAAGLAATAAFPIRGNHWLLVPLMIQCGSGFALFNVANNRNMFLSTPSARSGAAGGLQSAARLLGQTAGAVIMTLLLTLTSADAAPRFGLGIGAVLTLVAGLISALRVSIKER